jgi:hypothetical protein
MGEAKGFDRFLVLFRNAVNLFDCPSLRILDLSLILAAGYVSQAFFACRREQNRGRCSVCDTFSTLFSDPFRAFGGWCEEGTITIVRHVVLLKESTHIDVALPQPRFKSAPHFLRLRFCRCYLLLRRFAFRERASSDNFSANCEVLSQARFARLLVLRVHVSAGVGQSLDRRIEINTVP